MNDSLFFAIIRKPIKRKKRANFHVIHPLNPLNGYIFKYVNSIFHVEIYLRICKDNYFFSKVKNYFNYFLFTCNTIIINIKYGYTLVINK